MLLNPYNIRNQILIASTTLFTMIFNVVYSILKCLDWDANDYIYPYIFNIEISVSIAIFNCIQFVLILTLIIMLRACNNNEHLYINMFEDT